MNQQIIFQLFENTSKYNQTNKESLNELDNLRLGLGLGLGFGLGLGLYPNFLC